MAEEKITLSKQDRRSVALRSTFLQGSWNYERMQNGGWCFAMIPAIKKLYTNKEDQKAIARHEITCSLEDVVQAAKWLLKPGGHFYMVHRPFRLAEIIYTLKQYKLEPKRMRLVHPYIDKEPNMVLIDCAKGGNPRITVDSPLIVYNKDGSYTDEIYQIYGEMKN